MWADPDADYEKIGALQAELEDKIAAADAWSLERNVEIAMDALRCPPDDADVTTLSGGERRRVALCRLLLCAPRPAAARRADQPPRRRERRLAGAVPAGLPRHRRRHHPRPLLPRQRGQVDPRARPRPGLPVRGQLLVWLEQKQERLAREEKQDSARQRTLERELEWVRMAPEGPPGQGQGPPRRLRQAAGRGRGRRARRRRLEITIPAGRRLGDTVIEVEGLRKGFGDRLLIEDLSFSLPQAGIVGIIGPNGAGKTTLFKMITGQEAPDAGARHDRRDRRAGLRRPEPRHARRRRHRLRGDHRRRRPHQGRQPRDPRSRLRRRRSTSRAPISRSGSATSPAASATACTSPSCSRPAATCCCSTSRPTTSTSTRSRALEDALEEFPGCAVVISHDRWFLDRIATHVLAFEGDSQVRWFEGNFSEYEAWRHKELGAAADQPHRIKYKPLAR